MSNLFFCGGLPKSGTTLLQRILDLHPEISCNSEDNLEFLAQSFLDLHKKYNIILSLLASRTGAEKYNKIDKEVFLKNFYYLIKDIAINRNKKVKFIGLSDNNFLLKNLVNLSNVFSNSKTVIIFRNPIDMALSAWDHNHRLYKKEKSEEHLNIMKIDGELNLNKYIIQRSKLWNKQVKNILLQIEKLTHKFLVINYEDLCMNKKETIKKVFQHLGCINNDEIISKVIEDSSLEKMRKTSSDSSFFNKGRINFGGNELDQLTINSAIDLCKEGLAMTRINVPKNKVF
tara:strand:+ start:282 stop:1142 length:861 start_codon:yes stop_codon:yes gene_type:complete